MSDLLLTVKMNDDGQVVIVAGEAVSPVQWAKAISYWGSHPNSYGYGSYIEIPIEVFVEKMNWLREVWTAQGGTLEISPEIVSAAKTVKEGADKFRRLRLLDPERHQNEIVQVPGLVPNRVLTPEQMENILCLLEMENGANFSVPGSGKTLTALSVWKILRKQEKVDRLLVVCPRSAFDSWKSELKESFNDSNIFQAYTGELLESSTIVCAVNYEQLENQSRLTYLSNWLRSNHGMLVIDEAHRIKGGRNSVRWHAVKTLSDQAKRTDILTGTPMPQGPKDLIALYAATWPKLSRLELDERVLVSLKRKTAFVRTTKDELRLPPATFNRIKENPSPLQSEILSALHDRYLGPFNLSIADQRNMARRGKAVMTMLSAATNPGLLVSKQFSDFEMGFTWPPMAVEADVTLNELVQRYLHHEIPWKFKYVALRAQECANRGEKLLIWSSFIGNLAAMKIVLAKFQPAVVYGATESEIRDQELFRFQNDPNCSVLLSNPQTLGEGINLHRTCHAEIFVDRTYNAGLYLQAVDRIHRLGLAPNQETRIEILQTVGTIDERVDARLKLKISALATFLDDKSLSQTTLPQDDAFAPIDVLGLSDDDFADLVQFWGLAK